MESPTIVGCMNTLICIFHKYSGKQGDKFKLNNAEVKELLEKEFRVPPEEHTELKKIFEQLDKNEDGEMDFKEFMTVVALMTIFTHQFFQTQM